MYPIFLSIDDESRVFLYFNIVFGVSILLHSLSLFLLIKRTPPPQKVVRKYLIVIQIMLLANDIQFDVGLHGIPLFPVLAGYGTGLLLRMGMTVHLALAILFDLYIYVAVAITMCIFYRHQTVVLQGSKFKIKDKTRFIIEVIMCVSVPIPAIIWSVLGQDNSTIDALISNDPHCIEWIRERGPYYAEVRSTFISVVIGFLVAMICGLTLVTMGLFFHMFYSLWKDSSKRSRTAMKLIQRSIINLFVQLITPLFLFVVPALVVTVGMLLEDLFTFGTVFLFYRILPLHSIGHNIILLSITSAYHKLITSFVRRHLCSQEV